MNEMVISQTKTKYMFVVRKRLWKRLDNGDIIYEVKSHKLLGIHLGQDLEFDIQTEV